MTRTSNDDDDSITAPPPPPSSSPSEILAPLNGASRGASEAARLLPSSDDVALKKGYARGGTGGGLRPGAEAVSSIASPGTGGVGGRASVRAVLVSTESGALAASERGGGTGNNKIISTRTVITAKTARTAATATTAATAASAKPDDVTLEIDAGRFKNEARAAAADALVTTTAPSSQSPPRWQPAQQQQHTPHHPRSDLPQSVLQPSAPPLPTIEVVATAVHDDDDHVKSSGRRRKKNPFKDWRVLVLVMVMVAVIVGLTTGLVMNNKNNETAPGAPQDAKVEIEPFTMKLQSDKTIDDGGLVSVTESHLTEQMGEEFASNFKSVALKVKSTEARRLRGGGERGLAATTTSAYFSGFATFEGGGAGDPPPSESAVNAVRDGAFSVPPLNDWLAAANRELGVTSVAVFAEDGEEIGSGVADPTTTTTTTTVATTTAAATSTTAATTPSPSPETTTTTTTMESTPPGESTPAPTPQPTSEPTLAPTDGDDGGGEPIPSSTPEPTVVPTDAPTDLPTRQPTASPTSQPTPNPTQPLTPSPTPSPETQILSTTLDWKFSNRPGVMFDVTNVSRGGTKTITVTSLDVHLDDLGGETDIPVEVWTKEGTFEGYENTPLAWTARNGGAPYVLPGSLGAGRLTPLPAGDFESIDVPPGGTVGFYVTLSTSRDGMLVKQGRSNVLEAFEDENLRIEAGTANANDFGTANSGRIWNGAVRYVVPPG